MPNAKGTRTSNGDGCIRRRADGRYEAIVQVGINPATGKPIRKSIYGKTEAEVAKKKRALTATVDKGVYLEPSKMKVGEWLDIWYKEFTSDLKVQTRSTYESAIRVHLKPRFNAIKLSALSPVMIQSFFNELANGTAKQKALSAKTVKNIHGVFHKAIDKAYKLEYIAKDPFRGVELPRVKQAEMHPLTEAETKNFLKVIAGSEYELFFKIDLFTGMRESELIGLTWDRVDFENGTIMIDRQIIYNRALHVYAWDSPKHDKTRKLTPAPAVMDMLKQVRRIQNERRLKAGSAWNEGNFAGLVFTNAIGDHYRPNTVDHNVNRYAEKAGISNFRCHDLRHTYAVNAIRAGDDIKTVQSNLGHATAAFTLDKYAHYTEDMRKDSAARMSEYMSRFGEF